MTSHHRPSVTELVPLREFRRTLQQLVDEGRATPARTKASYRFQPIQLDLGSPTALSDALEELRGKG